jgi:hypothetical protein
MTKVRNVPTAQIRLLSWWLISFLAVITPQNVDAQDEPFATWVISDPQIWRDHGTLDENGHFVCPYVDEGDVIHPTQSAEPYGNDPFQGTACGEIKNKCTKDFVRRGNDLCNALAAHDSVVEAINERYPEMWPDAARCQGGETELDANCIYEGVDDSLPSPEDVIINGDLTENFGTSELLIFAELFQIEIGPRWIGLGNHDYQNNVEKDPKAARLAAENMANFISRQPGIVNYDLIGQIAVSNRTPARKGFRIRADGIDTRIIKLGRLGTVYRSLGNVGSSARQPWKNIIIDFYDRRLQNCGGVFCWKFEWVRIDREIVDRASELACFDVGPAGALRLPCIIRAGKMDRIGSLSYSFDKGRYRFIQLQNELGYTVDLTDDEIAPKDPPLIGPPIAGGYDIKNAEDWLFSELIDATADGKAIVINQHIPGGDLKTFIQNNNFNNIVAVFAGHNHRRVGLTDAWVNVSGHAVPVILSGATFAGTMIYAAFYNDYFNWAAIRAWSTDFTIADGGHAGEGFAKDRPSLDCLLDPDENSAEALRIILEFVTLGIFDGDFIDDLENSNFDTRCWGQADPHFIIDDDWASHHGNISIPKQGTVKFNISDPAAGGGATLSPPMALCASTMANTVSECAAEISIDNGSYDPDGGPVFVKQSPSGPYGLGDNSVTLTVFDSSGATDSCEAVVTVVDAEEPQISCGNPASVSVSELPAIITAETTDNCGLPDIHIEDSMCTLPGGEDGEIGKSCFITPLGDSMIISGVPGGSTISWSPVAQDQSGNTTKINCQLMVEPDQLESSQKSGTGGLSRAELAFLIAMATMAAGARTRRLRRMSKGNLG